MRGNATTESRRLSVRPSVREGFSSVGWMIEKWLFTNERRKHSVCGNAATEPRRPSVRPSGKFSLPLDERQNVHERTQHSVGGNDGAESSRFCQGAFLFRWMNEKWMVRNERSILCAETTVRNHVVCVSGSVHWPPLKMKRKKTKKKKKRRNQFSSLAKQDLQPLSHRFAARNTHFPNIPALLVFFSPITA